MRVGLKVEIPQKCRVIGSGGLIRFRRFRFKEPFFGLECAIRPKGVRPSDSNPRAVQEYFQREAEPIIRERIAGLVSMLDPNDAHILTAWMDANRKKPESILSLLDSDVPLEVPASQFGEFADRFRLPNSVPYPFLTHF